MKQSGLERPEVWQAAMAFAETVCREVISHLAAQERFALRDPLQRAAQSIPANLAEGYRRYPLPDQIRFCYIARGPAERQMLNGYIRYLRSRRDA